MDGTVVLIDPFLTRRSLPDTLLATAVHSDPEVVRRLVPRADAVLVGHCHFDHAVDVPELARLGATVYGSSSLQHQLGGRRVDAALEVEEAVVRTLAELKPGRSLFTNVEFYAGVVMEACGIPREMFTPTFAVSRTIGWCAHVVEQAGANRLIRPSARYVGPAAPQPVPAA